MKKIILLLSLIITFTSFGQDAKIRKINGFDISRDTSNYESVREIELYGSRIRSINGTDFPSTQGAVDFKARVILDGGTAKNLNAVNDALNRLQGSEGLVMIPSGVKPLVLYNQIPNNQDFEVARAFPATYVGSDGLIKTAANNEARIDFSDGSGIGALLLEPESENLLLRSEEINNATWIKGAGLTVNTDFGVAPDGTTTAEQIVQGSSSYQLQQNLISSLTVGETYTLSFWLKATIQLTSPNRSFQVAYYDGSTSIVSDNIFWDISNLNEWVRYSATWVIPAGTVTTPRIRLNGVSNGSETETYYIWGAQLEPLNYATSYIPTTTSTVTRLKDQVTSGGSVSDFNSEEGVLFVNSSILSNDGTNKRITIFDGTLSNRVSLKYDDTDNDIAFLVTSAGGISANMTISLTNSIEFNKIALKWKVNDFAIWVNGVEVSTDNTGAPPLDLNVISFDEGLGGAVFYGNVRQLKVFNTALTDAQLERLTTQNIIPFLLIGFRRKKKIEYKMAA